MSMWDGDEYEQAFGEEVPDIESSADRNTDGSVRNGVRATRILSQPVSSAIIFPLLL